MKHILAVAAVLSLVTVSGLDAQARSNTEGFLINAHVGGIAGNVEDGDTEAGFGFGAMAGYGFSAEWQLFLAGEAMSLDISNPQIAGGYWLYQGDLGVRINFPDPDRAFVAYLLGAFTGQFSRGTVDGNLNRGATVELAGFGGTVGTGFHYFFTPALALDTVVQFTFGQFTHADVSSEGVQGGKLPDNLQNLITRLNVGLTWYPQAPY